MMFLIKFGGDLLSHALRRSTIGATALNCRVRDGTGCFARAMTTKPNKAQTINDASCPIKCICMGSMLYCPRAHYISLTIYWIKSSLSSN